LDILLLAEHFLRQSCEQIQRSPCRLAASTHSLLMENRWSGNVRQLQNVIFRAAAICEADVIDCDGLELAGTELVGRKTDAGTVVSLEASVQAFEKSLLEDLYLAYPSTRQLAVRLQTSHTAIGQRLRRYGIGAR
jgi:transcriptional regulator of aroF, aroG, tyrA and aromatic amino acid transport